MEILLALIFGATVGAVLHYLMAGRTLRGPALAPMVGALVGGVTWLIYTWAGVPLTDPWIWIVSLLVPMIVVPLFLVAITRARSTHDANELIRLKLV